MFDGRIFLTERQKNSDFLSAQQIFFTVLVSYPLPEPHRLGIFFLTLQPAETLVFLAYLKNISGINGLAFGGEQVAETTMRNTERERFAGHHIAKQTGHADITLGVFRPTLCPPFGASITVARPDDDVTTHYRSAR